jgi:hypothetical protein
VHGDDPSAEKNTSITNPHARYNDAIARHADAWCGTRVQLGRGDSAEG